MRQRKASVRVFRDSVSKGRDKKDKQTLQAFLGADIHNTKESTPSAASSNVNIKFGEMLTNIWNLYFKASGLLRGIWDIHTLVHTWICNIFRFWFLHQPTNPMSVGLLANNAAKGTHLLRMHQWIFASPDFRGVPWNFYDTFASVWIFGAFFENGCAGRCEHTYVATLQALDCQSWWH